MDLGIRRSTRSKLRPLENIEGSPEEVPPEPSPVKRSKTSKTSSKGPDYLKQFKQRKGGETKPTFDTVSPALHYSAMPSAGDKCVGAHVSAAGGLHNAIDNALTIGCRSFALFVRNQRTWKMKPLEEEEVNIFREKIEKTKFPPAQIVPHGSYLLNCGSSNESTFGKSRDTLIEEVKRCEALGLCLYNFHPGSTCGIISVNECVKKIASCVNDALRQTSNVTILLENMSRQGNTIGGNFEELKAIIDLIEDQSRIGICFDTCHAFAAGYDLSTDEGFEQTLQELERVVGLRYLKAVHLNDSKGDLGCHKDRHEDIGKGKIGENGFRFLMNDRRLNGIPMILETPGFNEYSKQISLLYSFI